MRSYYDGNDWLKEPEYTPTKVIYLNLYYFFRLEMIMLVMNLLHLWMFINFN